MQSQNCTSELLSRKVGRIPFHLLIEECLFSNSILNNRFLLIPFLNKVFQGNFRQTKYLSEVCVLLIRKLCDMLLLDLEKCFFFVLCILQFLLDPLFNLVLFI